MSILRRILSLVLGSLSNQCALWVMSGKKPMKRPRLLRIGPVEDECCAEASSPKDDKDDTEYTNCGSSLENNDDDSFLCDASLDELSLHLDTKLSDMELLSAYHEQDDDDSIEGELARLSEVEAKFHREIHGAYEDDDDDDDCSIEDELARLSDVARSLGDELRAMTVDNYRRCEVPHENQQKEESTQEEPVCVYTLASPTKGHATSFVVMKDIESAMDCLYWCLALVWSGVILFWVTRGIHAESAGDVLP